MKNSLLPLTALSALIAVPPIMQASAPSSAQPAVIVDTTAEPVAPGKFASSWESLRQYEVPEWFRDAKFGIWAHWGPQCQPGRGDWYARHLYLEDGPLWGTNVTASHRETYGHPSKVGFKDVIHAWKAAKWDPEKLVALYKRAGAKYFFALANHHDNLDLWDSKYQSWNTLRVGPEKNIIAGWEKAARAHGLKFGVSVHASHAWTWYEPAQGADKKGPYSGIPYDGRLTAADGAGTWWEGLDPRELYEQDHAPVANFDDPKTIHAIWEWGNGATLPDQAYCDKFYNRTIDLINKYQPDLIYFDDTALPLWPASDAGLKIAAHFYNQNNAWRGDDGVLFGKILEPDQKDCMALDIERGRSHVIEPRPWQTDTCLGDWHYNTAVRDRHGYKSAENVVHTLIDVVSKNGNLLLSVPLDGDGEPDAIEISILEGIAAWMQINQEAIHGTRPWKVMGEGPQMAATEATSGSNFNEGNVKPLTAEDVRFTTKAGKLYAFLMGAPTGPISIQSLGTAAGLLDAPVAAVRLIGADTTPAWSQSADALAIEAPASVPNNIATVFEITLRD